MDKKKLISVILAVLILSTSAPAYAAMPVGSLDMIPVTLDEGQVATFRLPDYPPYFTDTFIWINDIEVTTTQYSYVPSMWFKIYVPSDGQTLEWTLAGVSSDAFTDYISVDIVHADELHKSRCYEYWQVAESTTEARELPFSGYYYIHLSGSDITTELSLRYSLSSSPVGRSNITRDKATLLQENEAELFTLTSSRDEAWYKIFVPDDNQTITITIDNIYGVSQNPIGLRFYDTDSKSLGWLSFAYTSAETRSISADKAGDYYIKAYCNGYSTSDGSYGPIESPLSINYSLKQTVQAVPEVQVYEEAEDPVVVSINLDSASAWAHDAIRSAVSAGYVPAEIQSNYTSVITRAEFCRMAVEWLEYKTGKAIGTIMAEQGKSLNPNAFSDTNDPDILAAYALGITNGTTAPTADKPGTFTPNGSFTREQAATMIRSACKAAGMDVSNITDAGFTDINTASSWAVDGINFVRNAGIMGGTSTTALVFSPKGIYSRQESIVTFDRI